MQEHLPKKRDQDAEGVETAPVVLVPGRGKAATFFGLGLFFVAAGFVLGAQPDDIARVSGFASVVFGALGAAVAVAMRIPGSTHLALDEGGMTHRHIWQDTHVAWRDIRKIGIFEQSGQRMVAYDLAEDHPAAQSASARMNRGYCGYSNMIPDTFGDPTELAHLLEAWRVAYSDPALPPGEGTPALPAAPGEDQDPSSGD